MHKKNKSHNLSQKIKLLRISNNFSQEYLAKRIGISRFALANYENDSRTPTLDVLVSISHIFKISTDSLLDIENKGYGYIDYDVALDNVVSLKGLSDENKKLSRAFINALK